MEEKTKHLPRAPSPSPPLFFPAQAVLEATHIRRLLKQAPAAVVWERAGDLRLQEELVAESRRAAKKDLPRFLDALSARGWQSSPLVLGTSERTGFIVETQPDFESSWRHNHR